MKKIILVRHGETAWNKIGRYQGQSDIPLSETGLKQAECLAQNFIYGNPTIIYASDLIRAKTTAQKLADKFKAPLFFEPGLREFDFGEWEGLTYEAIKERWPNELETFFRAPDKMKINGGESVAELQTRAVAALNKIIAARPDEEIALVAHGAVLRSLVCHALHIPLKYFWSIRQFNTAVSIFSFADGNFSVDLLNCIAHLSPK